MAPPVSKTRMHLEIVNAKRKIISDQIFYKGKSDEASMGHIYFGRFDEGV